MATDRTCSAACLLALKSRTNQDDREFYLEKTFFFNARDVLLKTHDKKSVYQCSYGVVDFSADLACPKTVVLTLSRCCDMIGSQFDLSVSNDNHVKIIESIATSIEGHGGSPIPTDMLDIIHAPRQKSQVDHHARYDLTVLAPFQRTNLVFPSTRTTPLKIVITFREPLKDDGLSGITLYGLRYFVNPEHRKTLFTESHAFSSWVSINVDASSTTTNDVMETVSSFCLNKVGRSGKISISSSNIGAVKNVRLSLTNDVDIYNGPAWPILTSENTLELSFNDLSEDKVPRSLVDFKNFKDAIIVIACSIDSCALKVCSRSLVFVTYSAGSSSYVKSTE